MTGSIPNSGTASKRNERQGAKMPGENRQESCAALIVLLDLGVSSLGVMAAWSSTI